MKIDIFCNNLYKDLCTKLGEISLQKAALDSEIKRIKAKLELLNGIVPPLKQQVDEEVKQLKEKNNELESDLTHLKGCLEIADEDIDNLKHRNNLEYLDKESV